MQTLLFLIAILILILRFFEFFGSVGKCLHFDEVEDIDSSALCKFGHGDTDVILTNVPPEYKTKILEILRHLMKIGLKEAQFITENTPFCIYKDIGDEQAVNIKFKIEQAGGRIDIIKNDENY